ncbi:hypothetical protein VTO42DRAFT_7778 [Malbranchea cinnamomea]
MIRVSHSPLARFLKSPFYLWETRRHATCKRSFCPSLVIYYSVRVFSIKGSSFCVCFPAISFCIPALVILVLPGFFFSPFVFTCLSLFGSYNLLPLLILVFFFPLFSPFVSFYFFFFLTGDKRAFRLYLSVSVYGQSALSVSSFFLSVLFLCSFFLTSAQCSVSCSHLSIHLYIHLYLLCFFPRIFIHQTIYIHTSTYLSQPIPHVFHLTLCIFTAPHPPTFHQFSSPCSAICHCRL